jgi:hypothetical protein
VVIVERLLFASGMVIAYKAMHKIVVYMPQFYKKSATINGN